MSNAPRKGRAYVHSAQVVQHHINAASDLLKASEYSEDAANKYLHGDHAAAKHYAVLAETHMHHAGAFMAEAAKLHAEFHGGNRRTLIG